MNDTLQDIGPVIVSILIIIVIALARAYSKTLAAITATMPINIMLALWIIYAGEKGDQTTMIRFTGSMVIGVGATLACVVGMWLASRVGWRIVPTIMAGYLAWGVTLVLVYAFRQLFWRS
jgi:hypothetical protein